MRDRWRARCRAGRPVSRGSHSPLLSLLTARAPAAPAPSNFRRVPRLIRHLQKDVEISEKGTAETVLQPILGTPKTHVLPRSARPGRKCGFFLVLLSANGDVEG